ncbi:MAG: glycosyltransferase family 4 protein [Alphaproteobacteria bacterium]|jgi:glycosyltransferase involved in cell wall biosynthesis|tara:strand:+ start:1945 stop:3090 length:1146 start_codon:yes stop_codon:yes gene_type:complete
MNLDIKSYSVLQVLPHLNSGGLVSGAVEISEALQKTGMNSFVASAGGRREREITKAGGKVINFSLGSKNPIIMLLNVYKLSRIIKKYKINIIHARSRAPAWSAYFAAKKMGIPFVTTFHGTYSIQNKLKKKYNSIMVKSDRVIAISRFINNHILSNYNIDKDKIVTIHRGINIERFNYLKVADERLISLLNIFNIPEDSFVVLLPGRITRWKGHILLIEAIFKLQRSDIICLFVGDSQGRNKYYAELEKILDKFKLKNNFRIIPNQSDMATIYKLADVVVSSSLDPEAFGRVIVEAQAMGRPTISANHGGGSEIIIDGLTGWLFKPGDADDLSDKINKALSLNKDNRDKLAINAIKRAKLNFNNETMCAKTLQVYAELANK